VPETLWSRIWRRPRRPRTVHHASAEKRDTSPPQAAGLGVLALNAGGITALTALWSGLPNDYKVGAFTWSFGFFAFGVITAVISLCASFLHDLLIEWDKSSPSPSPSPSPPPPAIVVERRRSRPPSPDEEG
jgi:hypothetical protein